LTIESQELTLKKKERNSCVRKAIGSLFVYENLFDVKLNIDHKDEKFAK
jgi:hypothetical protein